MVIFGKNGFIRKQEVAFAKRLLIWKYENSGAALPNDATLLAHAKKVVDEAHIIAQRNGKNVLEILKNQLSKKK